MKIRKPVLYLWVIYCSVWGCNNNAEFNKSANGKLSAPIGNNNTGIDTTALTAGHKNWTIRDFYSTDSILLSKVDSLYTVMSINERAAQLIMPGTGISKSFGLPFPKIVQLYNDGIIGGVLFLKGNRTLFREEIKKLNQLSATSKRLPPVFSCDCEPTIFHRKFTDADSMTAASGLKTISEVNQSASNISHEMRELGIHWNFAPVSDVNFNQDIIFNRSFGSDPADVIAKSAAFINASADSNIATTIKHFPGHGAVTGDSHRQLVYIDSLMSETENFRSIIDIAHPVSVMVGHIAVRNNKKFNTGGLPSSLSANIISGLLKNSMKFKGIVVTDAMNMRAVKNIPGADYRAIKAGNDLVVMPQNVQLLHQLLVKDLKKKSALGMELEISIKKILKLKYCLGLFAKNGQ